MDVGDSTRPRPSTADRWYRPRRALTELPLAIACLVGISAFLYPFVLPALGSTTAVPDTARAGAAVLVFAVVSLFCVVVAIVEVARPRTPSERPAKVAALLGAIIAIDATLRLVPSVGGASPIFFLIILTGAVFGPRLGFLTGSMTLLLSAALTGGIGPWLPYQMIGAGWVGLGAGLLPSPRSRPRRLLVIATYGAMSAIGYGLVLSLYAWPFAAPGLDAVSSLFWQPSLSLAETVRRYAGFYLVTSLGHDLFRAAGNAALILLLGAPTLRLLERARRRLSWRSPLAPVISSEHHARAGGLKA